MRPTGHHGDARVGTRRWEMLLFLAVSAAGVYALGSAMQAVSGPGTGGVGLTWLAIAGAAMWILFAQMGRVHNSWPRQGQAEGLLSPPSVVAAKRTEDATAPIPSDGRTGEEA